MQPVDRMNDRHRLHLGKVLRCQSPFAGSDQLHRQGFENDLCQFLSDASPHAATERHIAEARRPALLPLGAKAIRIKHLWALENCCCLMSVPDAVHHTPAFGNLVTL